MWGPRVPVCRVTQHTQLEPSRRPSSNPERIQSKAKVVLFRNSDERLQLAAARWRRYPDYLCGKSPLFGDDRVSKRPSELLNCHRFNQVASRSLPLLDRSERDATLMENEKVA